MHKIFIFNIIKKRFLMFYALTILLFFSSTLSANVEAFLKPVQYKSNFHGMGEIDCIYIINLDKRPEKFMHCVHELEPYHLFPYRFSAVNGWELPVETINQLGVICDDATEKSQLVACYPPEDGGKYRIEPMETIGRTYFNPKMTPGAIGIVLSHLSVLQDAYDSQYQYAWIMEDDIQVIQDPHLVNDRIKQLNQLVGEKGWHILFTDRDTKNRQGEAVICLSCAWRPNFTPKNPKKFCQRHLVNKYFMQVGARYGAYSYIINRSGMKKLLDFFKTYHVFLPFDMDYTLPRGIKLFCVTDDIVSTLPQALSDNENPGYLDNIDQAE